MANISVRMPNGELQPMTYPDDWTEDQVKEAIYKHFPQDESRPVETEQAAGTAEVAAEPEEEQSSFKSIGADAMRMLSRSLRKGVGYLEGIPGQVRGIKEEFKKDPLGETGHAAGQLGVALAEGGKSLANLALLPFQDPLAQKLSGGKVGRIQIPETTGLQDLLGLNSNRKGDELIKDLPDIAAAATGVLGLAKSGAKFLSKKLPIGPERIRQNAMTENIIKAAKEHGASKEEVEALKGSLAESFAAQHGKKIGAVTPSGQRVEASVKQKQIENLEPTANIPEKAVGELPMPPDKEKIMTRVREAKDAATEALSTALKAKEEHPLKAGQIISKHLKSLHTAASDLYNKVEKGYKGVDIPVDNTAKINETAADLNKLIQEDLASGESLAPGYGSGTSEQKALEAKIKSLEGEKVSASDVYDVQRTLQNRAQKARDASFKPGLDKIERTRLQKLAARHESAAMKLTNVLEKVGDPNTKAMLKEANAGWRTYKDISRSKVGKSILRNEGKIPADTMFKITGTGKGNEHLRRLVESDPELSNYILGQKFAKPSAHKELLQGNETVDAYIKRSPDVQDKMTKLRVALKGVSEGKTEYKEAQSDYKALKDSITKVAEEQTARKKALADIDTLKGEIKSHKEAADKLEKEISQAKAKGENTDKLKEDLARHKREYNEKGSRMDKLKSLALKYAVGKIGYETIVRKNNH